MATETPWKKGGCRRRQFLQRGCTSAKIPSIVLRGPDYSPKEEGGDIRKSVGFQFSYWRRVLHFGIIPIFIAGSIRADLCLNV